MDEKKENCKRCGTKISPKTKRAEFCSPKCKVYWHRENPKVVVKNHNKQSEGTAKNHEKKAAQNESVNNYPKTLLELKALCPFREGTDERRVWVAEERQKYNI